MSKRFCSDFLIGHYSEKDDIPFPKGLNPSDSLKFGSFKMSNAQAREHFSSLQLLTRGSDSSCDYQKHQIEDEAKVRLDSLPYYFLDNGELHGIPTLRRSAGCWRTWQARGSRGSCARLRGPRHLWFIDHQGWADEYLLKLFALSGKKSENVSRNVYELSLFLFPFPLSCSVLSPFFLVYFLIFCLISGHHRQISMNLCNAQNFIEFQFHSATFSAKHFIV